MYTRNYKHKALFRCLTVIQVSTNLLCYHQYLMLKLLLILPLNITGIPFFFVFYIDKVPLENFCFIAPVARMLGSLCRTNNFTSPKATSVVFNIIHGILQLTFAYFIQVKFCPSNLCLSDLRAVNIDGEFQNWKCGPPPSFSFPRSQFTALVSHEIPN